MANQWALLIGINHYSALQPLMYAQADAVALRNFFVDELAVPVDQCRLFTDRSAAIEPHAHLPRRADLTAALHTLCRDQVQPQDRVWIFFSGYGLTRAGQDYWMPIDGDPTRPQETAIALSQVFDCLKTAKTDQIILALDMNRSQGAVGHHSIGQQTLTLARDFGIATLLSCQPDQYAHETMAIRHGLFTKALLEGLRYHGCVTAGQLADYVCDRVPELSRHHWRPEQNPAVVIPPEQKFMLVVPAAEIASLPVTEQAAARRTTAAPLTEWAETSTESSAAATAAATAPASSPAPLTPASEPSEPAPATAAIVPSPTDPAAEEGRWGNGWRWGTAIAAVAFLVGVLVRYQPLLLGPGRQSNTPAPAETTDPSAAVSSTASAPSAETTAPEPSSGEPLFSAAGESMAASESALQRAEAAIAAGRFGEAQAWLQQVPPDQRNDTYESLLQQANSEVAAATMRNQEILTQARTLIHPLSASLFNDAIEQARQIPPEDPYYQQAQADMVRWSQVILDLAEGRAAVGDVAGAIAAARLVPEDQPAVYSLAQQRIANWQQQLDNQQLIQQTQATLQPGQASSFQAAILTLQQITPDQPGYAAAQERINQWSQDILAIARARAAQGDLNGAIAAARLVPEGTAAYPAAQEEIQRWQARL